MSPGLVHIFQKPGRVQRPSHQHSTRIALRCPATRPPLPDSGEISSPITIVEPSLQSRRVWEKKLASQGVFDILWNLYIKANIIEMERFYDLFQNSAATASAAGWLFESRMHQLLAAGMPIEIFRIGDRLAEGTSFTTSIRAPRDGFSSYQIGTTPLQRWRHAQHWQILPSPRKELPGGRLPRLHTT